MSAAEFCVLSEGCWMLFTSAITVDSTGIRPGCGQNCGQVMGLQVNDFDVRPPFAEVLGHEAPVAMMRLVFTAQEASVLDLGR